VHRLVDDLKRHKRRKSETLQTDADLGCALADRADVRRGGDDFVDTARAEFGTVDGELKRQPGNSWNWISVKLTSEDKSGKERDQRTQASHKEVCERRQLAELGRQPFELIVVDLMHSLGKITTTQFEFRTMSSSSCVSWPISAGSEVSWLSATCT
jgi:hypothetical protein